MTIEVKIYGAGSIGNHLAQASRRMGWGVTVVDIDPAALTRMKEDIYPSRYGSWDNAIRLLSPDEAKAESKTYDLIIIGTPPDSHIPIALEAVLESPSAILIEKPISGPDLAGIDALRDAAKEKGTRLFVGYDHAVSQSVSAMLEKIKASGGSPASIDVLFREHWGGIFAAHPWLDGPGDSYLGFTKRGGGALGEHSHGINLWLTLARELGAGRITRVSAEADFVRDGKVDYDESATLNLETESGLKGCCIQDVVTEPTVKNAKIQCPSVHAKVTFAKEEDSLSFTGPDGEVQSEAFPKTRPDDFFHELQEIERVLADPGTATVIDADYGFETMLVIAAALRSAETGDIIAIDYAKGYNHAALSKTE
jgi:predicted dehydrogenase